MAGYNGLHDTSNKKWYYPNLSNAYNGLTGFINYKFPDSFVQAFKTIVDSWTFSMLLLYILLDDWLISMISGSNEQLQQELEYTLLNPDCHSWWISKLQSGREDTLEERYGINFCFKLGQNATEMYRMLQTALRPSCMNRAWVFEWHKRFKEGRESVRDDERCGQRRSKKVNTPELIGQRVRVKVAPCDFWIFPKLKGCRFETIKEMKEAVTKVIDTLTQEDFHGAFQTLLEQYNKCIEAGGDYFERDYSFLCVLSIKVRIRKNYGNLYNDFHS